MIEPSVVDRPTAPRVAARPQLTAVLSALAWNVVPLVLLIVGVVLTFTDDGGDEGMAKLAGLVLAFFGVGLWCVATGTAAGLAAVLVRRQLRAAAGTGRPVTAGRAVALGALGALLGWIGAAVIVAAIFAWNIFI